MVNGEFNARHLIFSLVLFSMIILGFSYFAVDGAKQYGQSYADVEILNNTVKLDQLRNDSDVMINNAQNPDVADVSPTVFSIGDRLYGAWSTLGFLLTMPQTLVDTTGTLAEKIGVPDYIVTGLVILISMVFIFTILYATLRTTSI